MQNSGGHEIHPTKKEINMFSVSEKASEMIKEFLKDRAEAPSIRVMMQEGG
jgi:Fe-S cluster assembly iron-binding protein IscA